MRTSLAWIAVALLALCSSAKAQSTLTPVADAYVRDGSNAAKNFGKTSDLDIATGAKAGSNYDSYLKFDMGAVPAFAHARLRLSAALSGSGSVTAGVYRVADTGWLENAITWNNKPARGALLASFSVKSKTAAWFEVDLTNYLLSERAQGRNVVSLALHSAANTSVIVKVNSKEANSNRPQLVFTPDRAPSVSLTAPAPGTLLAAPASVNLSANVSDPDGSIAKVDFFQGSSLLGTVTSPPYAFAWIDAPAGRYSLTAKATDNSGVSSTSSAVNIVVDALPAVSFSAPATQSTYRVPAVFTLTASASDSDGNIAKVELYQDGVLLQTFTQPPYSVAINQSAPGTYLYVAKAYDNDGLSSQSSPLSVLVNPDVAPLITLSAPADGARFRVPASVILSASANDPDGSIARVDFYEGGTLLGSAMQAPYSLTLSSVPAGSHTYYAQAVDDGGITTRSSSATIVVSASPSMYYIHADQTNTPRVVTDQANRVVWRWDGADPFGAALAEEDPDGDGVKFKLNLRFPGQYFDQETGLHYNYFRDYDPGTGRYVESDPVGLDGGINTYSYVNGRPVTWADPRGLYLPMIHRQITRSAAMRENLSPREAEALAEHVAGVDFWPRSQEGESAPSHHMCNPGWSKPKCIEMYHEILTKWESTCRDTDFWRALHAVQDSYSPSHNDYESWWGVPPDGAPTVFWFSWAVWNFPHAAREFLAFGFDDANKATAELIRKWKDKCQCHQ